MIFSSSCSFICPCATAIRASGTSSASREATLLIDCTRLCTKKTWPSRSSSRRIAARDLLLVVAADERRAPGAVPPAGSGSSTSRGCPATPISSVRGIGVADIASTSTSVRSRLRYSLCSTPNRCSSSMITRPRSLEPGLRRQQPVRADHDVDGAVGQARAGSRPPRPRSGTATSA